MYIYFHFDKIFNFIGATTIVTVFAQLMGNIYRYNLLQQREGLPIRLKITVMKKL